MAEMTPEKLVAQEEADRRTDWERQRFEYYLGLRYNFNYCDVDSWLDTLYNHQMAVFKAQKGPSRNQIRKEADISFWENIFAYGSGEKKKLLDARKAASKRKLQAQVNENNAAEQKRCNAYNSRLSERLRAKLSRFTAHNAEEVEEYFTFALNQDSFSLDGNEYQLNYNLVYDPEIMQLVIDYELPKMDYISRTKEWKVNKETCVVPKEMNKTDYLEMYERILFDIALRTVGILFESDINNVVKSIVFNGSCVYNSWQEKPSILLSFEMPKGQYSYDRISRMDCIGKSEVAKLKKVVYLDDIHYQKPPADLWETPPSKLVVPLRSSFL